MSFINVFYQSQNECTRKVAEAIADECGVVAIDINIPTVVGHSDLLFIGMDSYGGRIDDSVYDFLDQLPANRIRGAALFSLSKEADDHMELIVNLLEHKGIVVYPRRLLLKGKYLFFNRSHPDEADLQKARAFADEVMNAFNG